MDRLPAAVSLENFSLSLYDADDTCGLTEPECDRIVDENRENIAERQNVLYAEKKQALLVILLAMDTGGKDPIIRDVLSAANPQACRVTAFKKESSSEKERDSFWRYHHEVPGRGEIGVFNRSYFDSMIKEDAHGDLDDHSRRSRYHQIRCFEQILAEDNITLLKLFLHITKDEQRHRLQERIDDPTRHWELSDADFEERKYWDQYMTAFETAIRETHTPQAPWHVITANRKWFRDATASNLILKTLRDMDPQYPAATVDLDNVVWY
jgi:PPK2 family polyphosphate:nucleotide phosphotransferase